ncbi:hypothetical protein Q1695_009640 [Nippostrongylus brasiliensis]|nr:hypothetical protein Q1695_009640 [Nippostrongylus brasiliensis]
MSSAGVTPRVKRNAPCVFCNRPNHQSEDCRTVKTPLERRKALRGQVVCWKCFAREHRSRACAREDCVKCNGDHHSSLCTKQEVNTPPVTDKTTRTKNAPHAHPDRQEREDARSRADYRSNCMTAGTKQPAEAQRKNEDSLNTFSNPTAENTHQKQLVLMTVEAQIKKTTPAHLKASLSF